MSLEKNMEAHVSKTMLITLWARAVEQTKPEPIIIDSEAEKTLGKLGHDLHLFDPKKKLASQVGCCIRGAWFDDQTRLFISKHPDANVIELGVGLDNRYRRLGSPKNVHWYELDVPEVMQIREQIMPTDPEIKRFSQSLFDEEWMQELAATNRPTLIMVEGVLMYFLEEEVKAFVEKLHRIFPKVWLMLDFCPYRAVGHGKYHDTLSEMKEKVDFTFSMKDVKDIEKWDSSIQVVKLVHMTDLEGAKYFSPVYLFLCKIPFFYHGFNQRMALLEIGSV